MVGVPGYPSRPRAERDWMSANRAPDAYGNGPHGLTATPRLGVPRRKRAGPAQEAAYGTTGCTGAGYLRSPTSRSGI